LEKIVLFSNYFCSIGKNIMANEPEDFFESKDKRPWSRIKDQILGSYMTPYIRKIATRGQPLLLIDAFAGPGKTNSGESGSPLMICKAAEQHAKGKYRAIFVNANKEYHDQLDQLLQAAGWRDAATPIWGKGQSMLKAVLPMLKKQSVFLYIDPFGLDCEFDVLEPFLKRNKAYSTEILINLHMPIMHRLAAREAYLNQTGDLVQINGWHDKLTRTLGGDYWKEPLLSDNGWDAKSREQAVIEGYKKRLSSTNYLTYTGSCPVQKSRDSATKYYMVFASPHPDAMVLLNDAMCKAFNQYMETQESKDTLFAELPWTTWRNTSELTDIVTEYVTKFPSNRREDLWVHILKDHFMRFTDSEYKKAVNKAIELERITCSTPVGSAIRPKNLLNDNCVLEPGYEQGRLFRI
jgi:three-Cys-motif partner protein